MGSNLEGHTWEDFNHKLSLANPHLGGPATGLSRELGVIIEDDAEKLFSSRTADIAVVAVSSYMDGLYEHLRVCADHGVNAVTIGGRGFLSVEYIPRFDGRA